MSKRTAILMVLALVINLFGICCFNRVSKADEGGITEIQVDTTVEGKHNTGFYKTYPYYGNSGISGPGNVDTIAYSFVTKDIDSFYVVAFHSEWINTDSLWKRRAIKVYNEKQFSELTGWGDDDGLGGLYNSGSLDLGKLKPNTKYYVLVHFDEDIDKSYSFKISSYPDDVGDYSSDAMDINGNTLYKYGLQNCSDQDCFHIKTTSSTYKFSVYAGNSVKYSMYKDSFLTEPVFKGYYGNHAESMNFDSNRDYWLVFYTDLDSWSDYDPDEYSFSVGDPNKPASTATPTPTTAPAITEAPASTEAPAPTVSPISTETPEQQVTVNVPNIVNIKPAVKKVTLKWKKSRGASGYQICRSIKRGKGYKTIKWIYNPGSVMYTDKKVQSGKVYYYRIRAFRIEGSRRKYGGWSPVKKVKVK